jgi:hypothetical protein
MLHLGFAWNVQRCVGPELVAQIDSRPAVDPTEARNAGCRIAHAVADRKVVNGR